MTTVVWGQAKARQETLEHELNRLVPVLRDLPGVQEAWVFGSLASGRPHAASDLDLLVIRETEESDLDRALTLWRELRPRVPTDLFVCTPEEAEQGGRFLDSVKMSGRKLW